MLENKRIYFRTKQKTGIASELRTRDSGSQASNQIEIEGSFRMGRLNRAECVQFDGR